MSGPSSIFCEFLIQAPCSLSAKLGSLLRDNNHPLRSSLQHFIVDLLLEVCSSFNQLLTPHYIRSEISSKEFSIRKMLKKSGYTLSVVIASYGFGEEIGDVENHKLLTRFYSIWRYWVCISHNNIVDAFARVHLLK